ncbi:hypothetical protein WBP07_19040 (plasmid) [Novosphingobium sp. BL-8A]|jgi:hypothetical protein|uniref:hypothetical protein n=1 Tax=Novosphingobium sp. BL-8A TaxID=3127639 RepID=UPI003756E620
MTAMYTAWMKAGFDFWMLGTEAGTVMTMRLAKIAAGEDDGSVEAELMVSEKVRAMIGLQTKMMTRALDTTPLSKTRGTLKHYRQKVAANDRRLRRSR